MMDFPSDNYIPSGELIYPTWGKGKSSTQTYLKKGNQDLGSFFFPVLPVICCANFE